jgi:hypothetical protein
MAEGDGRRRIGSFININRLKYGLNAPDLKEPLKTSAFNWPKAMAAGELGVS